MTKRIGPTFYNELLAAGLVGLPFSWGDDGTFAFDPSMTKEQTAAVLAVYATHDPDAAGPAVEPSVEDRLAALEKKAARASKLETVLVQKGTISADQIEAVAIDDAVADVKLG